VNGTYGIIAQALWLALPVTLAGLTHVLAIKRDLLPGLAAIHLDYGLKLRGHPLFGANKTSRGAFVMITACVVWTILVDVLQRGLGLDDSLRFIPYIQLTSIELGLLLGLGYIIGELPTSLIKRQLDIEPGAPAPGGFRQVFWLLDQIDSTLVTLLFLSAFRMPSPGFVLTLLGLTIIVHPAVAAIMVALGLKRRVG
jgi:hypothetical protein